MAVVTTFRGEPQGRGFLEAAAELLDFFRRVSFHESIVHISTINVGLWLVTEHTFFDDTHVKVSEEDAERRPHRYTIDLSIHLTFMGDEGALIVHNFSSLRRQSSGIGREV